MHVLGIDPGQRDTGVVLLDRGNLVLSKTISTNSTTVVAPDVDYLLTVCAELEYIYISNLPYSDKLLLALEGIVNPSGHYNKGKGSVRWHLEERFIDSQDPSLINVSGIAGAAAIAGAVALWADNHNLPNIVVEPAQHGKGPPFQYPKELHDPRGGCSKGAPCDGRCTAKRGSRRHLRSAWDTALVGTTLYKHRQSM